MKRFKEIQERHMPGAAERSMTIRKMLITRLTEVGEMQISGIPIGQVHTITSSGLAFPTKCQLINFLGSE